MPEETVTLELLARLLRNVQADIADFRHQIADFRDQMTVQTAILLRLESGQHTMAEELQALVRQQQRTADRLRALEEVRQ